MGVTIASVLRQPALRTPERTAAVLCDGDTRAEVSYAALDLSARKVAGALRARGLRQGDRVALCAANGEAFLTCWFGAAYAGCAVVPIPVVSAAPEIAFRVGHAGAALLISDAARADLAVTAVARLDPGGPPVARSDATALLDAAPPIDVPADLSPDALAMVLYTSGTTGRPKGATITHASLMTHTAALVTHTLDLDPDDRVLGVLPFTHSFGLRMAVLAPFYAGARTVVMDRFEAATTRAVIEREGVTWVPAVPTMFARWADASAGPEHAPQHASLRWCLSAGAPLADPVRRRAEARLGAPIREGYGLTEATFAAIDAPPGPPTPGSVGRPVWGVEVRIAGADGAPAARGETGEILVRGQNVMAGYLGDPGATAATVRDGYVHTGDLGRLDGDGKLFVVDRRIDLILRGGHNVYPSEVEDALAAHPSVARVAVIGRPDREYGEEVVAVVVVRDGAALTPGALDAFARERLAKTTVPREVAFAEALPLGPSGKVDKRALRSALFDGTLKTTRCKASDES